MSTNIYLYLKTHNKTGLKYLGKTIQDPYKYNGSGIHWTHHIKKYGYDITTEILFQTTDKHKLKESGLYYSNLWNIVESKDFANLTAEEGQGGYTLYSADRNAKISKTNKGRKNTWAAKGQNAGKVLAIDIRTDNIVSITKEIFEVSNHLVGIGIRNKGKKYTARTKKFKRINKIVKCPYCDKDGTTSNMKRYHFNNCKYIKEQAYYIN